jgi:PHD/YefM family antitoxin component YafN of YafNO toxin-antitoxin module
VGEEAIGAGEFDDDMEETYILRTKGNLNKK